MSGTTQDNCNLCGCPLKDTELPADYNCEKCGAHFCDGCATEMDGKWYCEACFKYLGGEEWRYKMAGLLYFDEGTAWAIITSIGSLGPNDVAPRGWVLGVLAKEHRAYLREMARGFDLLTDSAKAYCTAALSVHSIPGRVFTSRASIDAWIAKKFKSYAEANVQAEDFWHPFQINDWQCIQDVLDRSDSGFYDNAGRSDLTLTFDPIGKRCRFHVPIYDGDGRPLGNAVSSDLPSPSLNEKHTDLVISTMPHTPTFSINRLGREMPSTGNRGLLRAAISDMSVTELLSGTRWGIK